jgi:predicted nucleic acid-binding protein
VEKGVMLEACRLRERYQLAYWDSLVVAATLAAGCSTLYSEDMHDGLVVDDTLTIANPFRQS